MIFFKMMYFYYIDKKNLIVYGFDLEIENYVVIIFMSFYDYLLRYFECCIVGQREEKIGGQLLQSWIERSDIGGQLIQLYVDI